MITVKVTGTDKVYKMITELPRQLNTQIQKSNLKLGSYIQKNAKLRAPRDTGFLASQIRVYKRGKDVVIDTGQAYYAYYQEYGYTPHFIPTEYIFQHRQSPNIPGQYVSNPTGFVFVSRSKPFMVLAVEAGLSRLPMFVNEGIKKAINNARR